MKTHFFKKLKIETEDYAVTKRLHILHTKRGSEWCNNFFSTDEGKYL